MANSEIGKGRVALVTGANKGIGFEVARGLGATGMTVFLGARDKERGKAAADTLRSEGLDVRQIALDLSDHVSMVTAAESIESEIGHLDVLVNNAGIFDPLDGAPGFVDIDVTRRIFETNFFGTVLVTQAILPLIKKSKSGRIVNVSSGLGSLTWNADPDVFGNSGRRYLSYNTSKAALNMFTIQLAGELKEAGILVNAADPGYTATDLNGHQGHQTIEEGSREILRLSLLPDDGPTGGYFNMNGPVPW